MHITLTYYGRDSRKGELVRRFRSGDYFVQVSSEGEVDFIEILDASGRRVASATRPRGHGPRVTVTPGGLDHDQALVLSVEACIQLDLTGNHQE